MSRDNECIAFAYAKGGPMLKRYLEMNGFVAVEIWTDHDYNARGRLVKVWDVYIMNGESTGFPEFRGKLTEAKEFARRLADHTGLPFRGVND